MYGNFLELFNTCEQSFDHEEFTFENHKKFLLVHLSKVTKNKPLERFSTKIQYLVKIERGLFIEYIIYKGKQGFNLSAIKSLKDKQVLNERYGDLAITYGSCVTISLADMQQCFVESDGFLQSKLTLKNFKRAIGNRQYDFHNCVYKILPPIDNKIQQKLLDVLDAKRFHRNNLNDRKRLILELQQNLDGEINSNMSTHNKLNGTPVLFSSSSFHLVHLASMKFISLTKDKSDSYNFTLADFPNDKSLFKFLPCLSLQKQRSNIVMNRDIVEVCCTGLVHNRKGYLYTNFSGKKNINNYEKQDIRIYANLENSCRWVVNSYSQSEIETEQKYVSIGDVVSLNLSDRNFCLSASKANDPFEKLLKPGDRNQGYENLGGSNFQNFGNQSKIKGGHRNNNSNSFLHSQSNNNNNLQNFKEVDQTPIYPSSNNIQAAKGFQFAQNNTVSQFEDNQTSVNQQISPNQGVLDQLNDNNNLQNLKLKQGDSNVNLQDQHEKFPKEFYQISPQHNSEDQAQLDQDQDDFRLIKKHLLDETQVFFGQTKDSSLSSTQESSIINAFWKIEPIYFYVGGFVKWDGIYRLKHFVTGQYLTINQVQFQNDPNTYVNMNLTEADGQQTYFQFIPLQSNNAEQNKYISKESFYRLQHRDTQLFVGFQDEIFEDTEDDQSEKKRSPVLEIYRRFN